MFNAYLISTLKFEKLNIFEKFKKSGKNEKLKKVWKLNIWNIWKIKKGDKFNNITSAMFNAYLISTLKFENIINFWEIQNIWKKI